MTLYLDSSCRNEAKILGSLSREGVDHVPQETHFEAADIVACRSLMLLPGGSIDGSACRLYGDQVLWDRENDRRRRENFHIAAPRHMQPHHDATPGQGSQHVAGRHLRAPKNLTGAKPMFNNCSFTH